MFLFSKNTILLLVFSIIGMEAMAQASFDERLTKQANIATTINNLGIVGNSFKGSYSIKNFSSCEFPRNSGIEHLFEGSLWLGCTLNGAQTAVTTGAVDDANGYNTGKSGFEFTAPVGSVLKERSSLLDDPFYTPLAVSHQDIVADYTDRNVVVPGTNIPLAEHTLPLGADVHFEVYNYNFNFANFFVILNYTITNNSTNNWDSLYLGFWYDGVVRNTNITTPGGAAFFNKGGNGYIDSLYLGYEFDATGDVGFTESYVGMKFLGAETNGQFIHPQITPNFKDQFNTWQFQNAADPLYFFPTNDNQRYGKLTTGLNQRPDFNTNIRNAIKSPNNRSNLISVGPFKKVKPGEVVSFSFALICAKKQEDGKPNTDDNAFQKGFLVKNAQFAQTAFNGEDINFNGRLDAGEDRNNDGKITRFILPSPPDVPRTKFVARNNAVDIFWTKRAESSIDPISKKKDFEGYRIYKTPTGYDLKQGVDVLSELKLIAEFDNKNSRFNDTGLEDIALATPAIFEGDTNVYFYKYTINNLPNGWQQAVALTAFDMGDEVNNLESLESSTSSNVKYLFCGTPTNADIASEKPFAYPNPYYVGAEWEGYQNNPESKKMVFANLPKLCTISIYNQNGELIDRIEHNQDYNGSDIRWYKTYSEASKTEFSGGEHGWDLLSRDNQILARGLYTLTVKDNISGKITQSTFAVVK